MIEPFTHGISTQFVRHGHRLLNAIHGVQMTDYIIFKTLALITVNADQNPIDTEPFVDLDLGDCKCLLVVNKNCLTELCAGISQHQDIPFAIS